MRGGRTEERGGRGRAAEQEGVPAPRARGRGAEEGGTEERGEEEREEEEEGGEETETEDREQRGLTEAIVGEQWSRLAGPRGQLQNAADSGHVIRTHSSWRIKEAIIYGKSGGIKNKK